jgi:hypothetical protein
MREVERDETGLIIRVEKTKAMVQNRRIIIISIILKPKDCDTEVVRSVKYLGTVINNTDNETLEIKTPILAANNTYSSLQKIVRSKQYAKIIK